MRTITVLAHAVVIALALIGTGATADSDPVADICLNAASAAARDSGVPEDVLIAVSMVETGQNGEPWPWAVNIMGEPHRPGTEEDAVRLIEQTLQSGITNIDLGCFQLNLHWHSKGFRSVEDMLDPMSNAQYAARLLAGKYDRTGDWSLAAAAYHSATPEHAGPYREKFDAAWALVRSTPEGDDGDPDRTNGFPLLVAGALGSNGSLVPSTLGGRPLFRGR